MEQKREFLGKYLPAVKSGFSWMKVMFQSLMQKYVTTDM